MATKYAGQTALNKLMQLVKTSLASKADKTNATTSAAGLMSAEDKVKLDGVEGGATKTIVDDAMSSASTNPVQNKVIKQYVDDHAAVYEVTSTNVSDLGYDASEGASGYSVTFDASFDSILANLAANKPMKFNVTLPDSTGGFPVSFSTGYVSALNNSGYLFTGTILHYPVVLSIGALGSATVYLYGTYLPDPNPDDSDDGKSLVVNGHKWDMKKAAVDDAMSSTSTNPVQNKVVKNYVDTKVSGLQTADQVQAAISSAITGVYTPKGSIAFKSLPTAAAGNKGWVYNVTDAFTTTAAFIEGAGHAYGAGTNVVCVDAGSGSYKWDVLAGTIDLTELTATEVQTLWDSV